MAGRCWEAPGAAAVQPRERVSARAQQQQPRCWELSGVSLPQEYLHFLTHAVSPTGPQRVSPRPCDHWVLGTWKLGTTHQRRDHSENAWPEFPPQLGNQAQGMNRLPRKLHFYFLFCIFLLLCKHQGAVLLKREMRRWKLFSQVGADRFILKSLGATQP